MYDSVPNRFTFSSAFDDSPRDQALCIVFFEDVLNHLGGRISA